MTNSGQKSLRRGLVIALGSVGGTAIVSATLLGPSAAVQESRSPTRDDLVSRADRIFARHDCLACHGPDLPLRERLDPVKAPTLGGVTKRMSPDWIARFLADPRALRPDTQHPHQLAEVDEEKRADVALDIVHFLAKADGVPPKTPPVEAVPLSSLELGRQLYHGVGCFVCHGPEESSEDLGISMAELQALEAAGVEAEGTAGDEELGPPSRPGVLEPAFTPLPPDLAQKQTRTQLAAYLFDPVRVRPSGHCPSMSLAPAESLAIASYLLRDQGARADGSFESRPGLQCEVFEFDVAGDAAFDALHRALPETVTVASAIDLELAPEDGDFVLRFTGWIELPEDGEYTFELTSDDGARLWIDGDLVVDNGGVHPERTTSGTRECYRGFALLRVEMYDAGGAASLSARWQGPGFEMQEIPADALSHWPLRYARLGADGQPAESGELDFDPARAKSGEKHFVALGCVNCHDREANPPRGTGFREAPGVEQLSGVRPAVLACLRRGGRYDFDQRETGALLAAFLQPSSIADGATVPRRIVERTMTVRNCYGCHRRDEIGGVHPSLASHFSGDEDAELGDQGRFPPTLTAVGRKLRPEVLRRAIHGHETVRPYLDVRMPKVGPRNMGNLAEALESADARRNAPDPPAHCSAEMVDDGRRLAGDSLSGERGGLACVQCHDFRGTESLGVRAIDLATMHERLRFGWFRELLRDPASVDLLSRMGNLWIDGESPVQHIAGGEIDAQIERLWCWLAQGESMAPPPGLNTGPWAYEIIPEESTRLVSVFMKDVSPRVLCIGTPIGVHAAFDLEGGRLAKVWRGRFLNAMGTWRGRAGALEVPGSGDVYEPPAGLVVQPIDDLYGPWPRSIGDDAGVRALGRIVNTDGSVTVEYAIGDLRVAETIAPTSVGVPVRRNVEPEVRRGVVRTIELRAPARGVGAPVMARLAVARQFDRAGPGLWRRDGLEWPVLRVDPKIARTVEVLVPRDPSAPRIPGEETEGRTILDPRDVAGDGRRSRDDIAPDPVFEEIRVPILLRPARDGSEELVGSLTWEFAW